MQSSEWQCLCPHPVVEYLVANSLLNCQVLLSWKLYFERWVQLVQVTTIIHSGSALKENISNTDCDGTFFFQWIWLLSQQKHCVRYQTTTHARTMFATFCTLIFSPKQTTNFSHIFTLIGNKTPFDSIKKRYVEKY